MRIVRHYDIEGRFGPNRLARAGLLMFGSASGLWLLVVGGATALATSKTDLIAKVLILTCTVLLWPVATLGLLLLLCWLVIRIVTS